MPESMPAGGYLSDYLLYWYVVATLALFSALAWRAQRERIGGALAGLALLAAIALVGETWLRYVSAAPSDGPPTLMSRAWFVRHWKSELNERGFRGHDWPDTPLLDQERTLVVGDEVVAGYGLADFEDAAVSILARAHHGTDVVGVGVPTWSTRAQLDWLTRNAAAVRPSRILLLYSADDAADLLPRDRQIDVQALSESRSTLINPARSFVVDAWWYRRAMGESPWWRDRVQLHGEGTRLRQEELIRGVARLCAGLDIPLDVAVLPWPGDGEAETTHAGMAVDMWLRAGARRAVDMSPFVHVEDRIDEFAPWPDEDAHARLAVHLSATFFLNE
jgi:hypothetical protein